MPTPDHLSWIELLKNFGIPIALLMILIAGIWKVVSWLGSKVVEPLVEKQISFMDAIQKTHEGQSDILKEIKGVIVESRETNRQNQSMLQQLLGVK